MDASTFIFMKVPFDNTYQNVIDFPDIQNIPADTIYSRLTQLGFPFTTYTPPNTVYFRTTNGKTMFTLKYLYENLKDYNYLIVLDNLTNWRFYFVTGYSSLNSGSVPSTEITVEWDCWLNNINSIKNFNQWFNCSQGHIKSFWKESTGDKYYSKNIIGSDRTIANIEQSYPLTINQEIIIQWLRIWTDNVIYTTSTAGMLVTNGCYADHGNTPIIMAPFRAFNARTLEPVTLQCVYQDGSGAYHNFNIDGSIKLADSEHILKSDLTCHAPIEYTIEGSTFRYSDTSTPTLATTDAEHAKPYVYIGTIANRVACPVATKSNKTISFEETFNLPSLATEDVETDKILDPLELRKYQSTYYQYPYRYFAYYVNSSMYPVIFKKKCNVFKITVKCDKIQPYYIITQYQEDELRYTSKPTPIDNSGSILTLQSQYDSYLRNNGNQIIAQQQRNTWNFGRSMLNIGSDVIASNIGKQSASQRLRVALGGITRGISAYGDYRIAEESLKAKIDDIKNMQDEYNFPNVDALANIYQDAIILRFFQAENTDELFNICLNSQYYGTQTRFPRKMSDRFTRVFEYIQADGVNVYTITNNNEREIINSVLNSGVTMWHCTATNIASSVNKSAIATFDKSCNNIFQEVIT